MENSRSRRLGNYLGIEGDIKPVERLTLSDIAPAFDLSVIRLPSVPGEYWVTVEVSGTYHQAEDMAEVTSEAEAQLVLAEGVPPHIPDVPCLRGLKFYAAEIEPGEPFTEDIEQDNGETVAVEMGVSQAGAWVVEKSAILSSLWAHYGVNIASVRAAIPSTQLDTRLRWIRLRSALLLRAFSDRGFSGGQLSSVGLQNTPSREYIELEQVIPLLAVLDLLEAGDIKTKLPNPACAIRFNSSEEKAEVSYFDTWGIEGIGPVPYQPERKDTKINDCLRRYFRTRAELHSGRNRANELFVKARHDDAIADFQNLEATEAEQEAQRKEQITLAEASYQAYDDMLHKLDGYQATLTALYLELNEWAAKHKEQALQKLRYLEKVEASVIEHREALADRREVFVGLPNNMDGIPAHFAAIPNGLANGMELSENPFGQAILRVSRASLELKGQKGREQYPVTIPLVGLKEADKVALVRQAEMLLGEGSPRWLIPQGMVAVSKLYRQSGGYDREGETRRIYLNEWVDTMRPEQVARFREKGRGEAFGKGRAPRDLFMALLGILDRLTYEHAESKERWAQLNGFYKITAHGEDGGGTWAEIMLNPSLHKFIIGDEGLPYMLTNTQAMFSYKAQSLDYTPAAQWAIEQLARSNLYNRDTATLSTSGGDGFTRLKLASRFGLLIASGENATKLLKRFNTVLDNLGDAGVIAGWTVDGQDKRGADAFGVKVHIEMHDDYRKAYNLTRKENQLKHAEQELLRPFSVPKKQVKQVEIAPDDAPKKRRGRPPKAK